MVRGQQTPVPVPQDKALLIVLSALLLLVANSCGIGSEKLALGRDSAVAGAFKEGKS